MAKAAEQQVDWTRALYDLTLWEIVALSLTLIATGWAAVAAGRAAKASALTVNVMKAEMRANVVAKPQSVIVSANGPTNVRFTVTNVGNTEANGVIHRIRWAALPEEPTEHDQQRFSTDKVIRSITLSAKADLTSNEVIGPMPEQIIQKLKSGEYDFYVLSEITYSDIFGTKHHPPLQAWMMKGINAFPSGIDKNGRPIAPVITNWQYIGEYDRRA